MQVQRPSEETILQLRYDGLYYWPLLSEFLFMHIAFMLSTFLAVHERGVFRILIVVSGV
jgi:hypothetical protein